MSSPGGISGGGPGLTAERRSALGSVRFATYNLLDAFKDASAAGLRRHALLVESIGLLGADILAVQEIRAADEGAAGDRLQRLADETGLRCLVRGRDGEAVPALGFGSHGYHVGLLWRDGLEPVPGTFHSRNRDLWHALAWATFDVGGRRIRHAAYHATPFGRNLRAGQSEIVVSVLARPDTRQPTLVGADWNGESADRVGAGDRQEQRLYEPRDPYAGVAWFEDMVHQCGWDYDKRGRRRHWADRSAGDALWAGGLHDAAAALRAPWQATTGHYPTDPFGRRGISRRIDGVRVTAEVLPALRAHHVVDTDLTRAASDHLPVVVDYVPADVTAA